jgi:curli biogenesis system outer membrane secretion channel CsgG
MARLVGFTVAVALLAGCGVSGQVRKQEAKVEMRKFAPIPFENRKKVGIVEFEDRSNYGKGQLGTGASRVMTTMLVDCEQFRVFEREKLHRVMEEQKLQKSGAFDPNTAVQVGKLVGLDFVIYGAVTKFGIRTEGKDLIIYSSKRVAADCTVDMSVISVQTGEIVYAKQGDGTAYRQASKVLGLGGSMSFDQTLAEDSLRAAIAKMMDNLVERINR